MKMRCIAALALLAALSACATGPSTSSAPQKTDTAPADRRG
jgi:hypothetical protein